MSVTNSYSTSLQEIARDIRLQKIGPKVVAEKLEALALAMNANSGRELPESSPAWINADEQVPDVDGWVTVWIAREGTRVQVAEYWSEDRTFWPVNGKGEHWAENYPDVTHWMELKAPASPFATRERP